MSKDLDRKSKRILEGIFEYGGEAAMGEMKEFTGIEKNGVIHYRLKEKLEPMGLVETEKRDRGDGSLGVTVATLTDEGNDVVVSMSEGNSGPSLAEQVTILKGEVERLQETVEFYEGRVEEYEERLSEVEGRFSTVEGIEEQVEQYEETLETHADLLASVRDNRELAHELVSSGLLKRRAVRTGSVNADDPGMKPMFDESEEELAEKRDKMVSFRDDRYLGKTEKLEALVEMAEDYTEEGEE